MSRPQVALAAYLAISLAVIPLFLAGPGSGAVLAGAANGLHAGDGDERDLDRALSNGSATFCLIEKYDVTLYNVSMEVRHQEGTPFVAENLTIMPNMPSGDPDDPLIFENDKVVMDKLCSTLSLDHAPIKVVMTDPTIYNLTITGRAMKQHFEVGKSDELVLYITLKSGLELLPKILTAAHNSSTVSTTTWNATWDDGNRSSSMTPPSRESIGTVETSQNRDTGSHGPGSQTAEHATNAVRRTHDSAP